MRLNREITLKILKNKRINSYINVRVVSSQFIWLKIGLSLKMTNTFFFSSTFIPVPKTGMGLPETQISL